MVGAGWGKVGRVVGGFRLLSPLLRADELVCEMTQACRIIRTSILQKTTPPPEQDETPTHNVHAIASVCWEGELREGGGGEGRWGQYPSYKTQHAGSVLVLCGCSHAHL